MSEMNDIFREFAAAFAGGTARKREIAFPDYLKRDKLDLTVKSLHLVDEYLDHLHRNKHGIGDDEGSVTVLWGGAYVGEVIRRNAPVTFSWIDYNEYMPGHPDLKRLVGERTVPTCAFLCTDDGSMTMPLNKISRFIDEGPENSVHYYASVFLKR